jgi:hypothetical protein
MASSSARKLAGQKPCSWQRIAAFCVQNALPVGSEIRLAKWLAAHGASRADVHCPRQLSEI